MSKAKESTEPTTSDPANTPRRMSKGLKTILYGVISAVLATIVVSLSGLIIDYLERREQERYIGRMISDYACRIASEGFVFGLYSSDTRYYHYQHMISDLKDVFEHRSPKIRYDAKTEIMNSRPLRYDEKTDGLTRDFVAKPDDDVLEDIVRIYTAGIVEGAEDWRGFDISNCEEWKNYHSPDPPEEQSD